MIKTLVHFHNGEWKEDVPIDQLKDDSVKWFWADFSVPHDHETILLDKVFHFHPLAIEDCLHNLQRPKLDYYDDFTFFVVHAINKVSMEKEELDIFLSDHYIVTFHKMAIQELEPTWDRLKTGMKAETDQFLIVYEMIDKLVDNYFPTVYKIEDGLNEIEDNTKNKSMEHLMDELFDIRANLLQLRHTVYPMRDLLYRMLNSHHLEGITTRREYFADIYDHLLKLSEMIDSNREMTTDIRDSYLALYTHQTNRIMQILTVITTIFMPLTFIAGLYGMNFKYMPELNWHYSYFVVLGAMVVIAVSMFMWFRRKGWFN